MTTYTFEQISQRDADAFMPGDKLHFDIAAPSELHMDYVPGSAPSQGVVRITYGGKSLSFLSDALEDGDVIDFRTSGVSRGTIAFVPPGAAELHVFTASAKAIWAFEGSQLITTAGPGTFYVHTGGGNDIVVADNAVQPDGNLLQTGYQIIDLGDGDDRAALNLATGPADLFGGSGADNILGGMHNDHLYGDRPGAPSGHDAEDTIDGGSGNDYIHGNAGADLLFGGGGNDRIYGGADGDLVYGDDGNDYLQGNKGEDGLTGGAGDDIIRGGADDDMLRGGSGNDRLSGDQGDDALAGGEGADTCFGGSGADLFRFVGYDAAFSPTAAATMDRIEDFSKGSDHIFLSFDVQSVIFEAQGGTYMDVGAAAARANDLLSGHPGVHEVVAITVGSDTVLFYGHDGGPVADRAIRLDNVDRHDVDLSFFV
jgi:serralysin